MDTDSRALALAEAGAQAAAEIVRGQYETAAAKLDSPIERLLMAAFLQPSLASEYMTQLEVIVPTSGLLAHVQPPPIRGFWVWPQITVGAYRVDFIVASTLYGRTEMVIVECDGHDFHERTKQQAQRDKARDRFLASLGYRVLRFTGSEIYRDPEAVAWEIISILADVT